MPAAAPTVLEGSGRGYPAKIHAFARSELSRAKTDKADAKLGVDSK